MILLPLSLLLIHFLSSSISPLSFFALSFAYFLSLLAFYLFGAPFVLPLYIYVLASFQEFPSAFF